MPPKPTLEALKARQRPEWYDNAKLGIFIHWGVFSVPAWAPYGKDYQTLIKRKGYKYQIAHNPYTEWYPNTMQIEGSPSHKHHVETYGENFSYYDFIPKFTEASAKMDAENWADLFEKAGARYSVMVTKHHDGYTLWPAEHKNPKRAGMHCLAVTNTHPRSSLSAADLIVDTLETVSTNDLERLININKGA